MVFRSCAANRALRYRLATFLAQVLNPRKLIAIRVRLCTIVPAPHFIAFAGLHALHVINIVCYILVGVWCRTFSTFASAGICFTRFRALRTGLAAAWHSETWLMRDLTYFVVPSS